MELGGYLIATGHYARVREHDGKFQLLKGLDNSKDQSYFLYTLGQAQLSRTLFPLGELPKTEVRQIAEKAGFINHDKKTALVSALSVSDASVSFWDVISRLNLAKCVPLRAKKLANTQG